MEIPTTSCNSCPASVARSLPIPSMHARVSSNSTDRSRPPQGCRPRACLSHPVFRSKLNAFFYVCQDQVSHIKRHSGINSETSVYYIVSYYKNLLQVQKGLSNGKDTILPQADDWGFRTPRTGLHQSTPHLLSSRA
jgi:hypothetical protein